MNSLEVSLNQCKSPGILSAKIWIRDGSRADPINKSGIHSLLGSLLIRGCGPYNNLELADLVEGLGAVLISESYEDGLMISLKCTEENSKKLLLLIKYIIMEPHLQNEQIDLERQLSIQAISREKENQFIIALKKWKKIAYSNHPYSKEVLGSIRDLNNITRSDLLSLSENIKSRKKVIVISGSLPQNIDSCIEDLKSISYTSNLQYINYMQYIQNNKKNLGSDDYIAATYQSTKQVTLILGKPTIPHSHPDDLILRIISCHLGTGMSSILFNILREEKGLAYDVGVYHPIRELNAPFIIHASSRKDKALETLTLLLKCWNDLQSSLISNDQLNLAKSKFRYNMAYNSQTIAQKAERKAHLIGMQINENYDSTNLDLIDFISKEDILRVSKLYLNRPFLSICGPGDQLNPLIKFWHSQYN